MLGVETPVTVCFKDLKDSYGNQLYLPTKKPYEKTARRRIGMDKNFEILIFLRSLIFKAALFPLNGCRWFTRDIVNNSTNLFNFINNSI